MSMSFGMSDLWVLHNVAKPFHACESVLQQNRALTSNVVKTSHPHCGVVGVLVLSWYPPEVADDHGEPTEDMVPAVMDAAHRHSIKVTGETTGMFFPF